MPRGDGQRLQLPVPLPRLDLPQRRSANRSAIPSGGLRRRRRVRQGAAKPCFPHRISRATTACSSSTWTRARQPLEDFLGDFRFYLDFYTKQSRGGLEVRGPQRWRIRANWKIGAENFAGDMYHTPANPCVDRRDRPFPRTEGAEAQGRGHLLGAVRRWNHLQASAGQLRRTHALRRLPRRDDRPDQRRLDATATATGRRRRVHDLGRIVFPEPQFRAQLAQGAQRGRGRPEESSCLAVHFDPALAADQRERNRGLLVVRSGLRGPAGVQKELLQGLSDVLRIDGHVRTGRCGELGVVDQHRRRLDGATAAAEQPDGFALRRPPGRRAAAFRMRFTGPGTPRSATTNTISARCCGCGPTIWSCRRCPPPSPPSARRRPI